MKTQKRKGVALIGAVFALAVVTALVTTVAAQMIANRRSSDQRREQLQTEWLARSGVELAAAGLLGSETYKGETKKLAKGEVVVRVKLVEGRYEVVSEGRMGEGRKHLVSVRRVMQRVGEGDGVRIEVKE